MKLQRLFKAAVASTLAGICYGDIILSVAPPNDMNDYLGVLSSAWPTLYPKLQEQLSVAASEVPAEYSYLWQILSVTGVPSTYDATWAQEFVDNARAIGPTTIVASDIPGAESDPGVQPTQVISTDSNGAVATATDVQVGRPTIVVAINGNVDRNAHNAASTSDDFSDGEDSGGSLEQDQSDVAAGGSSSTPTTASSTSSSGALIMRPPHLLAAVAAGIGALAIAFF
ncbi:hypothetical protein GGI25_000577 [Coemansia spiralis]|uniref:Uncharacterized protein n=2 Tax=Coemansia TaxID=4863 RepID=A0A9W8GC24_9FUNG|nr:hypothetical protein BX070DRAFT_254339 [Coemansia spiralis]KAJ1996038.1 hypothetical protein EDC05_000406 [Coemansia umbellata]KAJ2625479.1 hypothetical protein GGI26_000619 [Coemansia sp. RSA 1358]KAJ2680604.1 hypothetical protein GGI25_000577 [Coemansia spiralis]